jgi:hypothetical protein
LAVTEYPTRPFPLPLAPLVTVIQVTFDLAVQAQVLGLVTVSVPVDALADGAAVVGDTVKEQVAPACVTVTGLPATVTVADREDVLVFAATLYRTVPLPVPLEPLEIVIQLALSLAVHVQLAVVVTEIALPVVPAAAGAAAVGETVNEQFAPA